eukprot:scaffold301_cov146-Skeletonema_menzelii.AAC.3
MTTLAVEHKCGLHDVSGTTVVCDGSLRAVDDTTLSYANKCAYAKCSRACLPFNDGGVRTSSIVKFLRKEGEMAPAISTNNSYVACQKGSCPISPKKRSGKLKRTYLGHASTINHHGNDRYIVVVAAADTPSLHFLSVCLLFD